MLTDPLTDFLLVYEVHSNFIFVITITLTYGFSFTYFFKSVFPLNRVGMHYA